MRRLIVCVFSCLCFSTFAWKGVVAFPFSNLEFFDVINWSPIVDRSSDYVDELSVAEKQLENHPGDKKMYLKIAKLFLNVKNYEQAFALLTKAKHKFPNDLSIRACLARVCIAQAKYVLAESYVVHILKLDPQFYEAYFLYGDLYRIRKQYGKAISLYEKALGNPRYQWATLVRIGESHFALKHWTQSLHAFREAEALRVNDLGSYFYLGLYYYLREKYVLGVPYLERVVLRTSHVLSMDILIRLYSRVDMWHGVVDIAQRLQKVLQPFDIRSRVVAYHLSEAYRHFDRFDVALQVIKSHLRRFPDDEIFHYMLDEMILREKLSEKFVEERQGRHDYWYEKGKWFLGQGNTSLATFLFHRASQFLKTDGFSSSRQDDEQQTNRYLEDVNLFYSLDEQGTPMFARPRIIFRLEGNVAISKKGYFPPYFKVENYFAKILQHVARLKGWKILVVSKDMEHLVQKVIREKNADFIVSGKLDFRDNDIVLLCDIRNIHSGNKYKKISLREYGDFAFLNLANTVSQSLFERFFPKVCRILERNSDNMFKINVGRNQGCKVGDVFYWVSEAILQPLLGRHDLDLLMQQDVLLQFALKDIFANFTFGLGENKKMAELFFEPQKLQVISLGDNFAWVQLLDIDLLENVRLFDYVIPQPK